MPACLLACVPTCLLGCRAAAPAAGVPATGTPATGAAADGPPRDHLGPVTGVCALGGDVASCSQAGIAWSRGAAVVPAPFRPFALAAVPDAPQLVLAGGVPARSGEVALLTAGAVLSRRQLAGDLLYAVAVAPDARRAVTGGADGHVRVLSLPELAEERAFHDHTAPCRAVAFAAGGDRLASAGLDGVVVLRDLASGRAQRLVDHTAGVECLALRADGARIASGARDGKVRVHTADGRLARTFARLGAEVLALAWLDEHILLAGLADGRLLALRDEGEGARDELAQLPAAVLGIARCRDQLALATLDAVRLVPAPSPRGH